MVSLVCCWAGATSLLTRLKGSTRDRTQVFAASLLLAMRIVHMSVWLRWGTHLIADPDAAIDAEALVGSMTGYWGGIFSATGALLFTPVYLSLKRRSEEMLQSDPIGEESRALLKDTVEVRIVDWVVRITTITAPAIIGQSGELFTELAK